MRRLIRQARRKYRDLAFNVFLSCLALPVIIVWVFTFIAIFQSAIEGK